MKTLESKFESFYQKGNWGGGSGFGSTLENTISFRIFLEDFVKKFSIQSISDIGCGDFIYMKSLSFINVIDYKGYDIVDFLIDENNKKYGNDKIQFYCKNLIEEKLKSKVDLVIIKDVLQHLSFLSISKIFQNINPYIFLLIVEDFTEQNEDIKDGSYRALNLNLFNLRPIFNYSTFWKKKNIKRIKAVYLEDFK